MRRLRESLRTENILDSLAGVQTSYFTTTLGIYSWFSHFFSNSFSSPPHFHLLIITLIKWKGNSSRRCRKLWSRNLFWTKSTDFTEFYLISALLIFSSIPSIFQSFRFRACIVYILCLPFDLQFQSITINISSINCKIWISWVFPSYIIHILIGPSLLWCFLYFCFQGDCIYYLIDVSTL